MGFYCRFSSTTDIAGIGIMIKIMVKNVMVNRMMNSFTVNRVVKRLKA